MLELRAIVQGSSNRRAPGFVNFVPAVAYHFYLNFPAAFTQPGTRLLEEPCTVRKCQTMPDSQLRFLLI